MACIARFFKNLAVSALRQGRIPRHVGFILDGNRRYARKAGACSTEFGHYEGFKQLERVLEMCMDLGVEAVTVFAFSIDNFNRSKAEVDYLMKLFCEAFGDFCEKNALVHSYGIQVNFIGNLSLLPMEVQKVAQKVMAETQHHTERIFNICCPYTSRDEMTTAIQETVACVRAGELAVEAITEDTIQKHLFTSHCPPLDIMVRTSGEIRLSDFLLWQANEGCQIQFVDCYWPEFAFWKLLPILLEYQIYDLVKQQ
ncbi:di-trans,poly-cis-decaprenylcistransferase [Sporodiniella umbellata]|nr:di-trans,poly-cis-decaprenylcistransferase [Sporodiniella umbellata]